MAVRYSPLTVLSLSSSLHIQAALPYPRSGRHNGVLTLNALLACCFIMLALPLPWPVNALSGPPFKQLLGEAQQQRYLGLHNDLGALVAEQQSGGWITLFIFTEGMREVGAGGEWELCVDGRGAVSINTVAGSRCSLNLTGGRARGALQLGVCMWVGWLGAPIRGGSVCVCVDGGATFCTGLCTAGMPYGMFEFD